MTAIDDVSAIAALDEHFRAAVDPVAPVRFRGNPSDVEVAAIMAVLAAARAAPQNVSQSPMSSLGDWGTPTDNLRYGLSTAPVHFVGVHYSR